MPRRRYGTDPRDGNQTIAPHRRRRRDLAVRLRPRGARRPGASSWSTGSPTSFRQRPGSTCARWPPAFELAWCTGWEEKANDYLPLALGLAGPLPHVEFESGGPPARRPLEARRDRPPRRSVAAGRVDRRRPRRRLPVVGGRTAGRRRCWSPPTRRSASPSVRSSELLAWAERLQLAVTENTGGSRVATVDQVAPASPEPNTSPEVAPKYSCSDVPLAGAVERLAQHRQVGVRAGRPSPRGVQRRAAVARLVHAHATVGRDPVEVGDERDHVGAVGIARDRAPAGSRSPRAAPPPISLQLCAGVVGAVDAAVELHEHPLGLSRGRAPRGARSSAIRRPRAPPRAGSAG